MTKQIKGVLGTKLGMTQVFGDDGRIVPVTVVAAGPCVVTAVRTPDADGYAAVQLGYGEIDPRKVNKPAAGHFAKAGVTPRRYLVELRTDDASDYTLGQEVTRGDVRRRGTGRRDRDQQGQGLRRGHEAARLQGPVRLARYPAQAPLARVHRRLRHPGPGVQGRADGRPDGRRARPRRRTSRCTASTPSRGLLLIKGAVPGPTGGLVLVRSAVKTPLLPGGRAAKGDTTMSAVNVVSASGRPAQAVELPAEIFDAKVNVPLIHQVVVAQEAAARQGTHATKTRGRSAAAAGSRTGRRAPVAPGRARSGRRSSPAAVSCTARAPLLQQRTPKKMKAAALRGALSDRARARPHPRGQRLRRRRPAERRRTRRPCWPP